MMESIDGSPVRVVFKGDYTITSQLIVLNPEVRSLFFGNGLNRIDPTLQMEERWL